MANLLYRASTSPTTPGSTSAKSAPLSNLEIDGNFKSLNDDLLLKAPLTGIGTSGSWGISVTGNSATVTNGLYSTGSYSDPTWITSLAGSKVTNAVLTTGSYSDPTWITSLAETKVLPTQTAQSGKYLTTNGTSSSWATVVSGASISDDTTTNASYYPLWATTTTGVPTTIYASSTKLYFNPSTGTLNATVFNSLSDRSLKENITQIQNAENTVKSISGVEFTWKDSGKKSAGVIAQDLEKILPWLVDTSSEGIKSVNYAGLTAYLIETIKTLASRIEVLENR